MSKLLKNNTAAHVLFEPEPFHADVAITLAAFSMGVCRHFDCAI